MAQTVLARHFDYTPGQIPIVRTLEDVVCAESVPDYLHARQIGYTPDDFLLVAYAWTCCDALYPQPPHTGTGSIAEYVESACWPLGPGPGISRRIALYSTEIATCYSARGIYTFLEYNDGTGKWEGAISLRNGVMLLAFSCQAGLPTDPGKFRLEITGCLTLTVDIGAACVDPLIINFGNILAANCCDCADDLDPATTDTPGQVNLYAATNCRHTAFGRHISYSAGQIPVVARTKGCETDQLDDYTCANMTCPITATITGTGDCACMDGSYPMDYLSGGWINIEGFTGCSSAGEINLSCLELSYPGTGPRYLELTLNVVCGATNTGSGSVIIEATELEDLDETIVITMADSDVGECEGVCQFIWNEMAATWSFHDSTCTESCDSCGETPTDSSPGSVDEEIREQACAGSATGPACCEGTISVRLMR